MDRLQRSVRRFPETLVLSAALVVVGIMMNHLDYAQTAQMQMLREYLMTLVLGIPAMTGIILLSERMGWSGRRRLLADLVAVALLVGFYLTVPEEIDNAFAIRYALLLTSVFLAFSLVPYAFKRENYSRYVLHLVTHFFITLLFSLVLFGGINAIIFTIEQLFEVNIDNDIHMDIFILIAGLFSVTHFLAHVPTEEEPVTEDYYPPVLRVLFIYIVVPLLSVYTMILYAYFIRLIMLREFPINMLGHLVVWYGLVSVVILFFLNRIRESKQFLALFYRWFPLVILVPLGMLFAAILSRIGDFGITPPRYFVLISGLWILASMLYIRWARTFKSTFLVVGAIVVLLVSAYGPVSAFNLSLRNQTARFEALLTESGMLENGAIVARQDLDEDGQREISDFVRYFSNYHGWDKVDLLPENFEYGQMVTVFGFAYNDYYPKSLRQVSYFYNREPRVMDISGYDQLAEITLVLERDLTLEEDGLEIVYDSDAYLMELSRDGTTVATLDIWQLMQDYHERRGGIQPTSVEEATIETHTAQTRLKIVIDSLYFDEENDGDPAYGNMYFKLFIDYN